MNNDPDNIRNLLLWLLQTFGPTFSLPSGNGSTLEASSEESRPKASSFEVGSDATSMKPADYLGSEGIPSYPSTFSKAVLSGTSKPQFLGASRAVSAQDTCSQTAQSYNFGEIHAVQERFQALLKQRLLLEYENNPPLFPWETEVGEYPAEVASVAPSAVSLWRTHVSTLSVTSLLPERLLDNLFERCQDIARSPIKQGVRLVRAVEGFFPDYGDLLEPIANMVLVPAYRSDRAAQAAVIQELATAAGGYDLALPEQQIALSMLAAQEILGTLTLCVNADKPQAQRHWVTAWGVLKLSVTYEANQLTVAAVLPKGGQVCLSAGDVEQRARRSLPGALDVVWTNPASESLYRLEVSLIGEDQPLNFFVNMMADQSKAS